MSIDFSQAIDRNLQTYRRTQHLVRNCLVMGTRRVASKDDSAGLLHRAAAAGASAGEPVVYALTGLEDPSRVWHNTTRGMAVVYARVNDCIYAVLLYVADASKADGLQYRACGVLAMDSLPAELTRQTDVVARGAGAAPASAGVAVNAPAPAPAPPAAEYANVPSTQV